MSPTILYAEDLAEDIFFMEQAFQQCAVPYRLQVVRDGSQAIDYLNGEYPYNSRNQYPLPSLILLDIKMPKVGGLEVLQWLRNQSKFRTIPVYMLSSSALDLGRKNAKRLGANGYWIKTQYEGLVDRVRQLPGLLATCYQSAPA